MRRILLLIVIFCSFNGASLAQKFHWTYVQIPQDSIFPLSLTFFDSLHGTLGAVTTTYYHREQVIYFQTTDGGKNWKRIINDFIGDSLGYFSDSWGSQLSQSPVVYGSLARRYIYKRFVTDTIFMGEIVHSSDFGQSWRIPYISKAHSFYPLRAFDPYNLVVYDINAGTIYQTTNSGNSYSPLFDSTYYYSIYHRQLDPHYAHYLEMSIAWGNTLSFDNSDRFHWTVALERVHEYPTHPPLHRLGLQTLVTENFGKTWKEYITDIPGQDTLGRVGGTLQYIKETPNLYYFTGERGEGTRAWEGNFLNADYGDAMLGINWMYSTDYGKSWEFNRQYGDRRRAYEAVKQNEIWITTRPETSTRKNDPATIIARTTDNGLTWQEDRLTLNNDGLWDGRMLTFTDPRHGWLAATDARGIYGNHIYIFRYDAAEQILSASEGNVTVKEPNPQFLFIYPNPSQIDVHLEVLENREIKKVEIYNLIGRQEYPPYTLQANIASVDVRNLPSGNYITRVTYLYNGNINSYSMPLIVQH